MILPWLWLAMISNMEQKPSERTMQLTAWDSAGMAYNTVDPTTHRRTSDALHANDVAPTVGRPPVCLLVVDGRRYCDDGAARAEK